MAIQEPTPTAASNLILPSLEIKNFRAFRHLQIEKLGRVNLITGKNNVGKSSLLEALWLYMHKGAPSVIRQLLSVRRELKEQPIQATSSHAFENAEVDMEAILRVRFLFHGRISSFDVANRITIRSMEEDSQGLNIAVAPPTESTEATNLLDGEGNNVIPGIMKEFLERTLKVPHLIIDMDGRAVTAYRLDEVLGRQKASPFEAISNHLQLVRVNGLADSQMGQLWDRIALTNLEDDVITALRLISNNIEKINLRGDPSPGGFMGRTPYIKTRESNEPIPLRSLGDGVNRLFGMALALVNAKDGVLLLDEVENGIHYSALPDVWRLIFQTARRLNVQVFATTHSWDCIEAFQIAAAEDEQEKGMLVKLRQNSKGDVEAIVFDEEELAVITREQIEVR